MTAPKLSRRTMLLAGAGTAALAVGGYMLAARTEEYLAALLRHIFPDETVEAGGVEAYVRDYLRVATPDTRRNARILASAARGIGVAGLDGLLGEQVSYAWFKRTFATLFMLNSDFFQREAPAPIAYVGLTPICPNPFARFNEIDP